MAARSPRLHAARRLDVLREFLFFVCRHQHARSRRLLAIFSRRSSVLLVRPLFVMDFERGTNSHRSRSIWALVGAGILTVFFSILADEYSSHYSEAISLPREGNVPDIGIASEEETFQRNLLSRFKRHEDKPRKADGPHLPRSTPTTQLSRRLETASTDVSHDFKNGVHIEIVEKERPVEEQRIEASGVARKKRVHALLSETRLHLQHLATRDKSDTETVDLVVRRVMGTPFDHFPFSVSGPR